ncbi:conserved hypothetical protein [Pediculus humanus corporis]|uniref:Rab-like protein 6 n=1 Tax=Pediculus humanus subsp. corporis TaxID=121224 RepID=E0VGD9_PEDHC|nr:uncharacterized protein Phum_PHUM179260 [Pediculus humanus corporis]EEB12445.1 conserved hypothetical protein [Pediculus humanus corporis]
MFSALKRLAGRGDAPETANSHPSHQTMSANLQRKFAKGVQYNMKIVIKGDRNVGKTCLFYRLQGKKFVESYIPTEEIQVASIHWNYKATDDIVKVEVWDVVDKGKKKKTFDGLKLDNSQLEIPEEAALDAEFLDVYKNTNGVILVMDITKSWTFNYIQKELPKIPEHIPIMILANHCDMAHHRTITPHHLTFYVENLQRQVKQLGPEAAEVRCCESSMRNGFGLKILHKFFNLPFLQLQRDTLLKQLETNKNETELTINELDLYMESEDADYNKFLDKLVQKRRIIADSAQPAHLQNSQSVQQLHQPVSSNVAAASSESEIKRSMSFNETYKIGPIGGGHPISSGLHKTAIGVGNPHSKIICSRINNSDFNTHSLGNSKPEQISQIPDRPTGSDTVPTKEGGVVVEAKSNIKVDNTTTTTTTTVDNFVPDDGAIDRFLEDNGSETIVNRMESDSESDNEFGNPLVSGFQDDLDPEDFNMVKNTYNDIKTPSNQNVKISSNAIRSNDNNYSFNKSKSPSLINEMSEDLGSMTIKPTTINHLELQNEEEKVSYLSENSLGENIADNNYDITGEALDTWFRCDSKWRRSPEGGEDNQSNNCQKIKEDAESIESDNLNNSLLDVSRLLEDIVIPLEKNSYLETEMVSEDIDDSLFDMDFDLELEKIRLGYEIL